jgi:hypothetical protein
MGKSRKGKPILKRKTSKKKLFLSQNLKSIKETPNPAPAETAFRNDEWTITRRSYPASAFSLSTPQTFGFTPLHQSKYASVRSPL